MGKVKLTKNKRRKAASGIPNWLLLTIVMVVVVAVVLTCVAMFVSSMGLVMRHSKAMASTNYSVNGNMMTYYYINTYSNFLETYGDYASSFSLGGTPAITEHRHIQFGGTAEKPNSYDALFLGEFSGTWFDYFMAQTKDSVKTMLMYCEEANVRGITLDKEDKENIKTSIQNTILSFQLQNGFVGYSDSATITAMYGEGIRKTDIRKAMELSVLASKCQEDIYSEIEAAATDDKVSEIYENNKMKYDLIDYYTYTFNLSFEDVAKEMGYTDATAIANNKEKIDAEYKSRMEEIKHEVEHIEAATDLQGFKKVIYTYVVNKAYDEAYKAKVTSSSKAPTGEATLTIIRNGIVNAVVTEALSGATVAKDDSVKVNDKVTLYEQEVASEFATAAKAVKDELFTKAKSIDGSAIVERGTYDSSDAFIKWAFEEGRKVGEIKNIVEGGQATEIKTTDKYLSKVYFLIKPQYKDEENARDVAYMLFEKKENAEAAIEKVELLGSTLTKDTFLGVASQASAAGSSTYEDYVKGSMQSDSFDAWLYTDTTAVGSYTGTPISMSDGSYMVAYYIADGEPCWKVTVKNHIVTESFNAYEDRMTVAHSANIGYGNKVIDRIAVDDSHSHD